EQFQAGIGRPARSLKKQFQAAEVPAWERNGPLLYSGGQLVFGPGLGLDARVLALPGQPQMGLHWRSG
ncbi:MAG TPA: TilS substrate C-terminal domain-containing protein, partial [Rhizobacter sp.]|nr:TilS substrate C-terminal domain-containing protein [Rhizobacter sp.]